MSLAATRRRREEEPERAEHALICRHCSAPTAHTTLANHGSMCFPCYASYCRTPPRRVPTDNPTLREMRSRLKGRLPGVTL